MKLFHPPKNIVHLSIISADPFKTLREISQSGFNLNSVRIDNKLTVSFNIPSAEYRDMLKLARRKDWQIRSVSQSGILWAVKTALNRPVLIVGFCLLLFLSLFIPSRVMLIQVEGNVSVPSSKVLDAAASSGVYIGAPCRTVRSEKVKNVLLAQIPQLQWIGVNTNGCVATISIREKKQSNNPAERYGVTSIVAVRDGVINRMYVSRGMPMCKPGQAVKAGELLVSGYTDCGICVHGTRAVAEIYADTKQDLTVKIPNQYTPKVKIASTSKKYALIIGKKRINLYKGSGIYGATCGKMYDKHYLKLPGGFQLPFGVIAETYITAEHDVCMQIPETYTKSVLEQFSQDYTERNMLAGKIISSTQDFLRMDEVDISCAQFVCTEMIGRVRIEEMVDLYEESN